MTYQARQVDVSELLELRTRILRPSFPPGALAHFDGDDELTSRHFALFDEHDRCVACLTLMSRPTPEAPDRPAVQLRGMAVDAALQKQGLGARLLDFALGRAAVAFLPARVVWCNARIRARSFYERAGFQVIGDVFEVVGVGPHVVMWRELDLVIA